MTQEASVSDFQQQAREIIGDIHARGKRAILAGGSGLYVRAALDVLEFPGTDPGIRRELEAELEKAARRPSWRGSGRWTRCPPAASTMRGGSSGRSRCTSSPAGRSVPLCPSGSTSSLPCRSAWGWTAKYSANAWPCGSTAWWTKACWRKSGGWTRQGCACGKTAPRALGYAQFLKVLDGAQPFAEAAEDTIVATRQFARRQLTWFRADPRISWLDWQTPDLAAQAAALAR